MADDVKLQSTPEMLEKYKNTKVYYLTDMPGEIEDFEKAIKKNPLDPENYAQIGVRYSNKAYEEKKLFEKGVLLATAVDYYSKAIELNPYNYRYYELRASDLERSGSHIFASKDYAKAIELINNSCNDEQGCINLKTMYYVSFANCIAGTTAWDRSCSIDSTGTVKARYDRLQRRDCIGYLWRYAVDSSRMSSRNDGKPSNAAKCSDCDDHCRGRTNRIWQNYS